MKNLHIHGGDVYSYPGTIDFSANCNPFGTPEGVKKAAAAAMEDIWCYPDVECRELRKTLEESEGIPYEQIICGNGAADLIFGLVLARKPKKALIPAPTFAEYEQALCAVGCKVEYYYLKEENGFVPKEDMLSYITEDTDMVFFCNPNNPTGVLSERTFLRKLADRCRECDTFLVLDECFTDFVEEPECYTMKPYLSKYENLFLLKAFTKRYAMAGLRVGYGFCSNEGVLKKMRTVMQPWNVSVAAQKAGVAALKEESYVRDSMKKIQEERRFLQDKLAEIGLLLYGSKANYIFFRGNENLWEECLKRGIQIRDCRNYVGLEQGFYRTAVRTRQENEQLIQVLQQILR